MIPKKLLFITGHSLHEPVRVSIHFAALAAVEEGHEVHWFVAGIGPATLIKNPEFARTPRRKWHFVNGVLEYHVMQLTTPTDLRKPFANHVATTFYKHFGNRLPGPVEEIALMADLVIVESGVAGPYLAALDAMKLLSRTVYFAADDISTIRCHPLIRDRTWRFAPDSRGCLSFGAHRDDPAFATTRMLVVEKGIDTRAYDRCEVSPYSENSLNVVSVGNMLFDDRILEAAKERPDVQFHLIGRLPTSDAPNIHTHGVLPFEKTVGYIKFANAGLLPYRNAHNIEYLRTSSMKLAQFRAARLPIIGPEFVDDGRNDFYSFMFDRPGSFNEAVDLALASSRLNFEAVRVTDYRDNWHALCEAFL